MLSRRGEAQVNPTLLRKAAAEALGTALLVAAVVGSGIMAERLAPAAPALALLCNTLATGAALVALIATFGPVSGAHFNPAVSLAEALSGRLATADLAAFAAAQVLGGVAGTWLAHAMFAEPILTVSTHIRVVPGALVSEAVATFGLLAVVLNVGQRSPRDAPFAVAAYITAAYWFTASTSFANPAVTLARALTHTYAGIRPADVLPFIGAQLAGALAATLVFRWLRMPKES
ncbi:MAG: aquaporin family protein [Deltaproteobacteria bacterium]|nr:aquaporin family protein [Deltaproteobacteria bacterium]